MRAKPIIARVQAACDLIAQHIHQACARRLRVTRMLLHFKLADSGRLHLLWCAGCRADHTLSADPPASGPSLFAAAAEVR